MLASRLHPQPSTSQPRLLSSSRLSSRAAPTPPRNISARVQAPSAAPAVAVPDAPPIALTDEALGHLKKLRAETGGAELLLRVGVRQGGCSGMSYTMDFATSDQVAPDDYVVEYDGGQFKLVVDPKSLLYLFGMRMHWSDALIGGGFQFQNPNATDSCGCGKSFGV